MVDMLYTMPVIRSFLISADATLASSLLFICSYNYYLLDHVLSAR